MKSKHTPGPWIIGKQNGHCGISIDCHEREVATVYLNSINSEWKWGDQTLGQPVNAESVANARLIAASPELLQCLEDAEFLLRKAGQIAGPMQDSFNRCAEDAGAAIAKAKGE